LIHCSSSRTSSTRHWFDLLCSSKWRSKFTCCFSKAQWLQLPYIEPLYAMRFWWEE